MSERIGKLTSRVERMTKKPVARSLRRMFAGKSHKERAALFRSLERGLKRGESLSWFQKADLARTTVARVRQT